MPRQTLATRSKVFNLPGEMRTFQFPGKAEVPSGHSPMVNILILPGEGRPGMLEALLCETFKGTKVDECIDAYFQCIPHQIPENRVAKSRVQAWISAQDEPHVSAGVAAKMGFFDLDHEALRSVRQFLESLSISN